ncbi:MAG: hypothetical protein JO296_12030 [Pseudonocardiales bacterium]|jgi:hypothetical protein|nr:hypothetical protein [Pseudonocardiales bacterium]
MRLATILSCGHARPGVVDGCVHTEVTNPTEVDLAVDGVPESAVRIVEPNGTTTLVTFFDELER